MFPFGASVGITSHSVPVGPGRGIWGVIQFVSRAVGWSIRCFNGGPSGPTTPLTDGLTASDPTGTTYGTFKTAICAKELHGPPDTNTCAQMSSSCVFGGLGLKTGRNYVPVRWRGLIPDPTEQTGVNCHPSVQISNPAINPNAQVTLIR